MGLKVKEINKGTLATFSEAARAKILEEIKRLVQKLVLSFQWSKLETMLLRSWEH